MEMWEHFFTSLHSFLLVLHFARVFSFQAKTPSGQIFQPVVQSQVAYRYSLHTLHGHGSLELIIDPGFSEGFLPTIQACACFSLNVSPSSSGVFRFLKTCVFHYHWPRSTLTRLYAKTVVHLFCHHCFHFILWSSLCASAPTQACPFTLIKLTCL